MLARAEAWLLEWVSATGRDPHTLNALDAGCGTGVFSTMLAQHGFSRLHQGLVVYYFHKN